MTGALPILSAAVLLSASSLLLTLYRVSPLLAPGFALTFFFVSTFIFFSSFFALVLSITKALLAHQSVLAGKFVSSSLRQGAFISAGSCIIILLHLLSILNWWIVVLVYAVFVLIEMAVGR